ncbi:MAG TPA: hypothetical protein VF614_16385 [Chthoniobacteraceae bacterium]|jgi:hypothetical protein
MSLAATLSKRVSVVAERGVPQKLAALQSEIIQARDAAIAWTARGIERMLRSGELLVQTQEALAGDFEDWLKSNQEIIGYGRSTAFTYMAAFRRVEKVGGLEKAIEDFPTQTELLLALGILPPRPEAGSGTGAKQPLFTIKLRVNGPPPEEWTSLQRREYLQEAKAVVDLYERVRALEGEA